MADELASRTRTAAGTQLLTPGDSTPVPPIGSHAVAAMAIAPRLGADTPMGEFCCPKVLVAGRRLIPTPVFRTYWKFAEARHDLYLARLAGGELPWSPDPILREYRFTNVFRAADRVSQFLIREVIHGDGGPRSSEDMVFRVLLFKFFNKISTWRQLEGQLGEVAWSTYAFEPFAKALDAAARVGPVYSPAYVIPPPRLGESTKRRNHLRLLELIMRDGLARLVDSGPSLKTLYETLSRYPSVGRFLAFQFTIDLNYTPLMEADENEFVVAGPGACDGIRKCFGPAARGIEEDVIRHVTDHQKQYFQMFGLKFDGLFSRRLHLIDCQNLFCEVDKYARVAHPDVVGASGRARIKQRFRASREALRPFFPPKWGLRVPLDLATPRGQQTLFSLAQ
jgi:alpha-glutamyl/putrescinyl thymine pyrophosphorylase clade 1